MNNFIGECYLSDPSICDKIIEYYKSSPHKSPGHCRTNSGDLIIDKSYKDCSELVLNENEILCRKYVDALQYCCQEYIKQYPFCNNYSPWKICEPINIQQYGTNQGFHQYHTERIGSNGIQATRHLVFMTYLNDVEVGGETEFPQQKVFIKPKKGLTLIWPADWTHTHRGIPAPLEEKYIVTGWYNYI
jgi:hypothetical protein